MSLPNDTTLPEDGFYVLVTGANSGLGLAIGTRMIDEFLLTRETGSLVLIVTTRDQRKGDATIEKLGKHLRKVINGYEAKFPGSAQVLQNRIYFRQERLDLLSLVSVQKLSKKLRETVPKLDVVICNAGIGGWTGINYPFAVWSILTHWPSAVSWPPFKISGVGWLAKPQIPAEKRIDEPQLGEVFCANFFGHYLLGHYLAPLLARHSRAENTKGRIVWVSSLEAYEHVLDLEDIQGIGSSMPYEATKRLTDVMALTSRLPAMSDKVDEYLDCASSTPEKTTRPRIYVAHPGICGTAIITLPIILEYLMLAAFYVARWLGSQWHPVTPEKGACAPVWVALAKQSTLDSMEEQEGVGKWGSATDFWGQERVERTEVAGWGWGGKFDEVKRKNGRDPFAKDLTKESHQRLVDAGEKCWEEMERMRLEWEGLLRTAGVAVEME